MRNSIRSAKVKEIRELLAKEAATVSPEDSIQQVIEKLLANPVTRHVYVSDENNRMVGTIRMNQLVEYIFPYETIWLQDRYDAYLQTMYKETAGEIMLRDFLFVKDETTVSEMVTLMDKEKINELPVLNEKGQIIGEVNFMEVLKSLKKQSIKK